MESRRSPASRPEEAPARADNCSRESMMLAEACLSRLSTEFRPRFSSDVPPDLPLYGRSLSKEVACHLRSLQPRPRTLKTTVNTEVYDFSDHLLCIVKVRLFRH